MTPRVGLICQETRWYSGDGYLSKTMKLLKQSEVNEAVARVMELQFEKDLKQKDIERKDLEMEIQRRQHENEILEERLSNAERDSIRLQSELLTARAKAQAVLCNRHLIEFGLANKYKQQTMSKAYLVFRKAYLEGTDLNSKLEAVLTELRVNAKIADVRCDLTDLIHECSKQVHYPAMQHGGFMCGGEQPLGAAVAFAVLKLQEMQALSIDVTFVDEEFRPRARLSCGQVHVLKCDDSDETD